MKLNQAISQRLSELLAEKSMTQYQLFMKSDVPKSTIGNVINCSYDSVKLRIIHEIIHMEPGVISSLSAAIASTVAAEAAVPDTMM